MRFIHCADIHLDSVMETDLSPEEASGRRRELFQTFMRLFDWAQENHADAVLISGDLFDSDMIGSGTAASVLDVFAAHPDLDIYYLRGNHDSNCSPITDGHIPDNLHLFHHSWIAYEAAPGILVAGAELFTASEGSDAAEKSHRLLSALSFNASEHDSTFRIVMLHGTLTEGTHSSSPDSIPSGILRGKGIDYLALGHIHAPREGDLDGRCHYVYPGCLEGRGFDECGPRGFVVLDIDENTFRCTHTFVPFAFRTLHRVKADISGCTSSASVCQRVCRLLQKEPIPPEDMVNVILTGETDVGCDVDEELIRRELESSFYMVRITDCSRTSVDYDAYALDASLKGAFVRLVQRSDLDESDRIRVIRTGFRALEGDDPL